MNGSLNYVEMVAHAGPSDTAVFFFAGHVRLLGPGRQAMVTSDGRLLSDEPSSAGLRARYRTLIGAR